VYLHTYTHTYTLNPAPILLQDNHDFKSQKIPFTRDNQYMIAAYNYSLAEIEERLFCRVLRAKFPKKSDKSRAPGVGVWVNKYTYMCVFVYVYSNTHTHSHTLYYTEPRVHFALSLGCASSPRIRIYQARVFKSQYTVT
jgi:hypothetical protein